jgi:hypothetical protein
LLPDLRDLAVVQLLVLGLSEPLPGADCVLNAVLNVKVLQITLTVFTNFTGQSTGVSILPLHTIGVDVAILTPGDTVRTPRFFTEGTVGTNVAKSEAAVVVLVAVPLKGLHRLLSLGCRPPSSPTVCHN